MRAGLPQRLGYRLQLLLQPGALAPELAFLLGPLRHCSLRRLQFSGLSLQMALLRRQTVITGLKPSPLFLQPALQLLLRLLPPRQFLLQRAPQPRKLSHLLLGRRPTRRFLRQQSLRLTQ